MRTLIVAAILAFTTQAHAAATALACLFKPTGERFNLVSIDQDNFIQWGNGKFEGIVAKFDNPYLTVTQYGYSGTFRMVYDATKGMGYGGVKAFSGKEMEGEILCAAQ